MIIKDVQSNIKNLNNFALLFSKIKIHLYKLSYNFAVSFLVQ